LKIRAISAVPASIPGTIADASCEPFVCTSVLT
jgi:hypothetical protein